MRERVLLGCDKGWDMKKEPGARGRAYRIWMTTYLEEVGARRKKERSVALLEIPGQHHNIYTTNSNHI
jgi:hypothetical protein